LNLAHVHLLLNHIPIVGIPMALVFLVFGILKKNPSTQRFALVVLFLIAAITIPVYLTGEPAEHKVEHLPGVAESFIEAHEVAAIYSWVLSLATGTLAIVVLCFQKNLQQASASGIRSFERPALNWILVPAGYLALLIVSSPLVCDLLGRRT